MTLKDYLTVDQAADHLGVSNVRVWQLIHDGRISASKFSGTWAIEKASLESQRATIQGRGVSRAMSARTVWALAALLDRTYEDGLTASARYKLIRRARHVQTVDQVRRWAERRYRNTLTLSIAKETLDDLLGDTRTAKTGVSAESTLVGTQDEVELLVHEADLDDVIEDHELDEYLTGDIKATVHVLAPELRATTSRLIVALDLADSINGRTRDLGRRQIERLLGEMRAL